LEDIFMSQPSGDQEVSIADLVINDLSQQIAGLSRDLAVKGARVTQLEAFIRANAEILGLTTESAAPAPGVQAEPSQEKRPRTGVNGQNSSKVAAKG
jgi:uncharacterized membrane protein YjjP (DUF1212 family)